MSISVCLPVTGLNLLPPLAPNDDASRQHDSNCIPATPDNYQQALLGPLLPLVVKPSLVVQAARWLTTNPVGQVALAAATAYAVFRLNSSEDKPNPPELHPAAVPNPEQPQVTSPNETLEPNAPADAGVASVPDWRLEGSHDDDKDEPPQPVKKADAPLSDEQPKPSHEKEIKQSIEAFVWEQLSAGLPENMLARMKQLIDEYAGADSGKAAQLLHALLGPNPQENTRRLSALRTMQLSDGPSGMQAVLQATDAAVKAGLSLDDYMNSRLAALKHSWVQEAAQYLSKQADLNLLAARLAGEFVGAELAGTPDLVLQAIGLEDHQRHGMLAIRVNGYLDERATAFGWHQDPRHNAESKLNQWRSRNPSKVDLASLEAQRALLQAAFDEANAWCISLLLYMRSLSATPDQLIDDDFNPALPERLASELLEITYAANFIRGDLQKLEEDKKAIEQLYQKVKRKAQN